MQEMTFGVLLIAAVCVTIAMFALKEHKPQVGTIAAILWVVFGIFSLTIGGSIFYTILGSGSVLVGVVVGMQAWAFRDKTPVAEEMEETLEEAADRHDRERIANRSRTEQMRAEAAERRALNR